MGKEALQFSAWEYNFDHWFVSSVTFHKKLLSFPPIIITEMNTLTKQQPTDTVYFLPLISLHFRDKRFSLC